MKKKYLVFYIFLFLSLSIHGQDAIRTENLFKNKTRIDNPFELRDPFKMPMGRAETENKGNENSGVMKNGVFTNLPALSDVTSLSQLTVVGVLIGKDRRAIVKIEGKEQSFVLKEGMKLGPDQAELKAILPGGVVFVEKMLNVYGQDEYLETVIPISK